MLFLLNSVRWRVSFLRNVKARTDAVPVESKLCLVRLDWSETRRNIRLVNTKRSSFGGSLMGVEGSLQKFPSVV